MDEIITLNHGAGGRQSHDLISRVFAAAFGMPMPLTDSAIIEDAVNTLAFTTDSYVVDPVFFPELQTAVLDYSQAPPFRIAWFEYFGHNFSCGHIA